MGVEENGKGFPNDAFAMLVRFGNLIAGQRQAEAAGIRGVPIRFGHLGTVRLEPVKVFYRWSMNLPALEEVAPPKDWLSLAQAHHLADKVEESALFRGEMPIEPSHWRVLAVRIVIPVLRLAEFIPSQQHGHAL